jgi:hypothetical protein
MRVGCDDVNLGTGLLELGVVVSRIFHFGGAVEGESGGHENEHAPLALQGFVGHGNELAIVEGLVLELHNLGVDERHEIPFKLRLAAYRALSTA